MSFLKTYSAGRADQRFNELLHGDHDVAVLAQELFNYTDREGNATRTLLLSATPYRMPRPSRHCAGLWRA